MIDSIVFIFTWESLGSLYPSYIWEPLNHGWGHWILGLFDPGCQ